MSIKAFMNTFLDVFTQFPCCFFIPITKQVAKISPVTTISFNQDTAFFVSILDIGQNILRLVIPFTV